MTFAPAPLIALGKYLVSQGCVNLGVVGDTAHQQTGTSYHLGQSQLKPGAYSATGPRDREPYLTEAASAIDIGKVGGGYPGLRALSSWLASQCQRRAIDTLDIREVIYSPDGVKVFRWDEPTQTVYPGGTGTGQGDDSHLTHTHVSYFRDSETRDKLAVFRRYFEGDEVIKAIKGEDWTPTVSGTTSNGVFRESPSRAAPIVERVGANVVIRSIAEIVAENLSWRVTERMGKVLYMLRTDWNPLVPGGDPVVDQQLSDYIAQKDTTPYSQAALDAACLDARGAEWDRIALPVQQAIPARP